MEEIKKQLKSFFTEHWKYMAVSTACKLNIFDHLQQPKTAKQLAEELLLNKEKTSLLLNALCHINFLTKENKLFKINTLSELLTENHTDSLKYACLNWSQEHLTAWQNLDYSIKTGESSFEQVYKLPFFDYLDKSTDKLDNYHKAMNEYARDDYMNICDCIDFSRHKSIMDVGGGYGAILEVIKENNPNVECVLFDLPTVVANVVNSKIKTIGGSFFEQIPIKSDAIILSRILHDWNDDKAIIILKNCFKALPNKGTLYVIENCTNKVNVDFSLLSLNMTAICKSYERTSNQYIFLCESIGLYLEKEVELNEIQTILIFTKNELERNKNSKR